MVLSGSVLQYRYFNSSPFILSSPGALLLRKLLKLFLTSSAAIFLSGFAAPWNGGIASNRCPQICP